MDADGCRGEIVVREATGYTDAAYLNRLLHHWFGSPYNDKRELTYDVFDIAGWEIPDDTDEMGYPLQSKGYIAEHQVNDSAIPIGGGIVTIDAHRRTVERLLPDSRFEAAPLADKRNAWFLVNVVDQHWRGKGVGAELLKKRIQWVREQTNATIGFAIGWEREVHPTSRPLFEGEGFIPIQTFPDYYSQFTVRSSCPDCQIWPNDDHDCSCGGTLWAKENLSQTE